MIELKRPSLELLDSYVDFIEEMKQAGDRTWELEGPLADKDREEFVASKLRSEFSPKSPFVPETKYWAVKGSLVVGKIEIRHRLDAFLSEFGGHIGYDVRPSVRKQGIGKEMLRLILLTAKAREIGRLLLTCAPDNEASKKTILANGGVFEKTIWVETVKRDTSHYWIKL